MTNGKKNVKSYLVTGTLLAIIALASIGYFAGNLDQVRISQGFAQQRISERLPISKNFKVIPLLSANLTVRDLQVSFRDDAHLEIHALCGVSSKIGEAEFKLYAAGIPEYRNRDRSFYFKPAKIYFPEFSFSPQSEENAKSVAEIGKSAIETQLSAQQINHITSWLNGKKVKNNLDMADKEIADWIVDKIKASSMSVIETAITAHLDSNPIKKLDGANGEIISLAVKKISIDKGELVIDFSLLKLTSTLLLYALISITVVAAVITAPFWLQLLSLF